MESAMRTKAETNVRTRKPVGVSQAAAASSIKLKPHLLREI
jgi:hypothetical protein